jgi:subtilisin family serine protease
VNTAELYRQMENFMKMKTTTLAVVTEAVKKYPDMLFVAAAGNDGGWSDNKTRVQFPCGLEAENVLCVGALTDDGLKTSFTNVPFNNIDLVFAPGNEVESLAPSDRCPEADQLFSSFLARNSKAGGICKFDKGVWSPNQEIISLRGQMIDAQVGVCESNKNLLVKMSGTSMASPLVAHFAATLLLENPEIKTGKELIALIKSKAKYSDYTSGLKQFDLDLKVPNWELLAPTGPTIPLR